MSSLAIKLVAGTGVSQRKCKIRNTQNYKKILIAPSKKFTELFSKQLISEKQNKNIVQFFKVKKFF